MDQTKRYIDAAKILCTERTLLAACGCDAKGWLVSPVVEVKVGPDEKSENTSVHTAHQHIDEKSAIPINAHVATKTVSFRGGGRLGRMTTEGGRRTGRAWRATHLDRGGVVPQDVVVVLARQQAQVLVLRPVHLRKLRKTKNYRQRGDRSTRKWGALHSSLAFGEKKGAKNVCGGTDADSAERSRTQDATICPTTSTSTRDDNVNESASSHKVLRCLA